MPTARRHQISPEIAFGRVLKELRGKRGLSQEELAARSGYHRTYIGQLERAEKSPSLRTLCNLAGSLDASLVAIVREIERLRG